MPIVLRDTRLGSMFDQQPVLNTPPEVQRMQQLIAYTPMAQAVTRVRSAPLLMSTPVHYSQAVTSTGTVDAVPQTGMSSSIAAPTIGMQSAGVDQRAPLIEDTTSAQQGTQSPTLSSAPFISPDQIPSAVSQTQIIGASPGGDVALPGGTSSAFLPSAPAAPSAREHGLSIGIAIGVAAILGIGVAVAVAASR